MILCDTGVIVAAINPKDKLHRPCVTTLSALKARLVTTQACIAESLHLVRSYKGWDGQQTLISWIETGLLNIYPSRVEDNKRACTLMREYADAPMDFADATLVAAAEVLGVKRILTIDKHFFIYRINNQTHFELLP